MEQMTARQTTQDIDRAMETVLDRNLFDGTSPKTTGPIEPQVPAYVKQKMQIKAVRHFAAAVLFGAACAIVANASMQNPQTAAPTIRRRRRPIFVTHQNARSGPAIWQAFTMTVTMKASLRPTSAKK